MLISAHFLTRSVFSPRSEKVNADNTIESDSPGTVVLEVSAMLYLFKFLENLQN